MTILMPARDRSGTISPVAVAHVDPPDVRNVGAIKRFGLNVDLPGAAEQVEVADVDATERRLQGGKDVVDGDAERLCLAPVDVEIQGRIGRGEASRIRGRAAGRALAAPISAPVMLGIAAGLWPSRACSW